MSDEIVQISSQRCGVCGQVMDAIMPGDGGEALAKAGDLSVCVVCMTIGVLQEDGMIRIATSEECEDVPIWVRHRVATTQTGRVC